MMKWAKLTPAATAASIAAMALAAPAAAAAPKAPDTASKASQITLKANKPSETTKKGVTWLHATASYKTPSKTRITKVCVKLNVDKRAPTCGKVLSSSVGGVSSRAIKCGKKGTYYYGVRSVAWALNKYGDQVGDKVRSQSPVFKC